MGGAAGCAGAAVDAGAEGVLLLGERLQQLLDVLAAAEDALPDPRDEVVLPPLLRGRHLQGRRRQWERVGCRRVRVRHEDADWTGRDTVDRRGEAMVLAGCHGSCARCSPHLFYFLSPVDQEEVLELSELLKHVFLTHVHFHRVGWSRNRASTST